jgi:pSer/pThr/pTyr-binding forkhead associated (FHA) protein
MDESGNASVTGGVTLTLLNPVRGTDLHRWTFPNEVLIRIGRNPDNEVVIPTAVVSRYHAMLRFEDEKWELVGIGSNGTLLDGEKITHTPVRDALSCRASHRERRREDGAPGSVHVKDRNRRIEEATPSQRDHPVGLLSTVKGKGGGVASSEFGLAIRSTSHWQKSSLPIPSEAAPENPI